MITAEDIIKLITLSYWAAMLAMVGTAWFVVFFTVRSGKRWWVGGLATLLILALFIVPIAKTALENKRTNTERKAASTAAKAVFNERCKDAGYKIYKTVEDVEGVTLLNVWPTENKFNDQQWKYAGLPNSLGGDAYIRDFLSWRLWNYEINDYSAAGEGFAPDKSDIPQTEDEIRRYKLMNGFQYVDVMQTQGYQRYQYKNLFRLKDITTTDIKNPSRYTVELENPIIPNERKIWIATTKALIKDQQTGELLGEATWHSFHVDQGVKTYSSTGIWDRAIVCPEIANRQYGPIQYFVLKVLKPKQMPQETIAQIASDAVSSKSSQAQPN